MASNIDIERIAQQIERELYQLRVKLQKMTREVDAVQYDLAEIVRSLPTATRKTAPKPSKG